MRTPTTPAIVVTLGLTSCIFNWNQQGDTFTDSGTSTGETTADETTAASTPSDPDPTTTGTDPTSASTQDLTTTTTETTDPANTTHDSHETDLSTSTTQPDHCGQNGCEANLGENAETCPEDCILCGDGLFHPPEEECDDNNPLSNDDCVENCKKAMCGDEFVWTEGMGTETCDNGMNDQGMTVVCRPDCTYCGDGIINHESEQCDDGGLNGPTVAQEIMDGTLVTTKRCSPECTLNYRYVFITSESHQGDFGGVEKADEFCTDLADDHGIAPIKGRQFRAWLSTMATSPKTHPEWIKSTIPYVLTDSKSVVASNFTSLTSVDDNNTNTHLKHPITRYESGATLPPNCDTDADGEMDDDCRVWTNTATDGNSANAEDCVGWTSKADDEFGLPGVPTSKNSEWTQRYPRLCDRHYKLYCFEQ